MLLPSGNPFKCHEEVLSLQSMFPTKPLDIFSPEGGCSEGLDAFRFFLYMVINFGVQYNGGLLPDIILLTLCYYIGDPF